MLSKNPQNNIDVSMSNDPAAFAEALVLVRTPTSMQAPDTARLQHASETRKLACFPGIALRSTMGYDTAVKMNGGRRRYGSTSSSIVDSTYLQCGWSGMSVTFKRNTLISTIKEFAEGIQLGSLDHLKYAPNNVRARSVDAAAALSHKKLLVFSPQG